MVMVTLSALDVAPSSSVTTSSKICVTALSLSELSVKVGCAAVASDRVAFVAVPVPPVRVH